MEILKKIRGIIGSLFQLGIDGPQLKNESGVLASRTNDDQNYSPFRAAAPIGENDVVIKSYVRTNINSAVVQWSIMSPVSSIGDTFDGLRIVPFDADIEAIYVSMAERGNNGNTIIDINVGTPVLNNKGDFATNVSLSTIYTNQTGS